jgi:fatty-acyl-CoA synthase
LQNVYPREIEDFLFTHPEIANVSVFGVTDEIMGEEVAAYCKLKPNSSTSEEHIRKFCHGKIAHYKIPRYVRFVEHFPLTASGKIQKVRYTSHCIQPICCFTFAVYHES